ncbi:unnamed protein product [Orchesella dallaii]|uniref:G-protein coupled receptors family 1 profile domain-containing protein n=1 Tax=Orchesella dallaii TaxID=48710 RepID=A0ABP1RBC8_9HEXA
MPSPVASAAAILLSTSAPFLLTFGTIVNYGQMSALSTNWSSNNFSSAVAASIFSLNYSSSSRERHFYRQRNAQTYHHHRPRRRIRYDDDDVGTQAEDMEAFDEATVAAAIATLGVEPGTGSPDEYITARAHNATFNSSIVEDANGSGREEFYKIHLQHHTLKENEIFKEFMWNNNSSTGNDTLASENGANDGDETNQNQMEEFNVEHDVGRNIDPSIYHHVHKPISTTEPTVMITDDKGNENMFYHPPRATITFTTVILVLMFSILWILTMIGNVLVCLSLTFVKKLRKPQNYLIGSLAVSDLFVALFVMPFAIVLEIYEGQWPFDKTLCDFWVSADVLCCTASILNLCGISVDRYRAITTPLEYSSKTTPRRMLAVIFVVWLGSACVSLPPVLLLGNVHKDIHENSYCSVSQNFWYQIYATMASFYVPLCVMVVVYVKILRVVADKKKQMGWKPAHPHQSIHRSSSITTNHSSSFGGGGLVVSGSPGGGCGPPPPHALVTRALVTSSVGGSPVTVTTLVSSSTSSPIRRNSLSTMSTITAGPTSAAPTPPPAARGSPAAPTSLLASNSVDASNVNNNKKDSTGSQNAAATTPLLKSGRRGSNTSVKNNYLQQKQKGSRKSSHNSLNVHHNHSHQNGGNGSAVTYFFSSTAIHRIKKEKLFGGLKEHKASTVLGIIMSAFVICWLPFFVLALVRPFLSINGIEIPPWMGTLFNWLGYANSALNPVIYATLNRDFRKPFREILCLRCSTLDDMMRREFYHQQYGDDHDRENYLRRLSRPQTENEVSYATEGPTNV